MPRCEGRTKCGTRCRKIVGISSSDEPIFCHTHQPWIAPECSCCLEPISKNVVIKLPCDHNFHHDCIKKWFQQDKDSCPMCRTELSQSFIMKIDHMWWERRQKLRGPIIINLGVYGLLTLPRRQDMTDQQIIMNVVTKCLDHLHRTIEN